MSDLVLKQNGRGDVMADAQATRTVTVAPRIDVLETEDEFLLLADLPGVNSEEVDIRFEKGELTIHGRRHDAHPGKEAAATGVLCGRKTLCQLAVPWIVREFRGRKLPEVDFRA